MKISAKPRGFELSSLEWTNILRTDQYLAFRRNALTVEFKTNGGKFHEEIYNTSQQVMEYLREHTTDLWYFDGASNDGYRTVYFVAQKDAVAFRIRWHDADT